VALIKLSTVSKRHSRSFSGSSSILAIPDKQQRTRLVKICDRKLPVTSLQFILCRIKLGFLEERIHDFKDGDFIFFRDFFEEFSTFINSIPYIYPMNPPATIAIGCIPPPIIRSLIVVLGLMDKK